MKHKKLSVRTGFWVTLDNRRSQVAAMNIQPGGAEGGPSNRHHGADQWLYIIKGTGIARLNYRRITLHAGSAY